MAINVRVFKFVLQPGYNVIDGNVFVSVQVNGSELAHALAWVWHYSKVERR